MQSLLLGFHRDAYWNLFYLIYINYIRICTSIFDIINYAHITVLISTIDKFDNPSIGVKNNIDQ